MRVGLKHHQSTSAALCINPMTQPRGRAALLSYFTGQQRRLATETLAPLAPWNPLQQLKVRPPNWSQTSEGEPGFVVVCVVMAVVISDPSTGK